MNILTAHAAYCDAVSNKKGILNKKVGLRKENSISTLRIFHIGMYDNLTRWFTHVVWIGTVTGVNNGKVEVRGTNIPAIEFNADSNLFLMNHGGSWEIRGCGQ